MYSYEQNLLPIFKKKIKVGPRLRLGFTMDYLTYKHLQTTAKTGGCPISEL